MAFTVAPLFLLLGVLGMKLGWKPNPDMSWTVALPLWTGAHLAYIIGNLAMVVVIVALCSWCREAARGGLERGAVTAVAVVGVVGSAAMTGQMIIDLIVGFRAGARTEMSAISRSIQALPGFETFFYGVIPALGLAGVAVLALAAAARRQLPGWAALVVLAGSLAVGTGSTAAMIAGGAAMTIAMPAMTRGGRAAPAAARGAFADAALTRS